MKHSFYTVSATGFAIGIATSCISYEPNKDHCQLNGGDSHCAHLYPDGPQRYCTTGLCLRRHKDGCTAERPTDECYSPCGDVPLAENSECLGVASSSSGSGGGVTGDSTGDTTATEGSGSTSGGTTVDTTTGDATETGTESGTTTSPGCMLSSECQSPTSPICVDTQCVACGDVPEEGADAACLAKDPDHPVCGASGACVQCTASNANACGGTTPVCDEASETCVGCSAHAQCPGTACNFATGACFDDGCVVEVDGDGGADYTSIGAALADECVVVHENDGQAPYTQSVQITNLTVALLAAPGERPSVLGTGGNPTLLVDDGATVVVDGLRLSGNTSGGVGLGVEGAMVYVDRTEIANNNGGGVRVDGGGSLFARNSIIGGDVNDIAAVHIESSTTARFLNVTLFAGFGNANALRCAAGQAPEVRNSILVARTDGPEVACDGAQITYSAAESDIAGRGNENVGNVNVNLNWFTDVGTGQFTLSEDGAPIFAGIARWRTGDPPTDIHGDPRPTTDNAEDYAGADRP